MSIAQSGTTWVRQTFSWSNSPRSWAERGIVALLVLLALALLLFGPNYSLTTNLLLWAGLLLATVVALRFGQINVFGPVLFYDMVRTARQSRYALLRMVYAGLLLLVLFWVYMNNFWRGSGAREAAVFAQTYFEVFILVQLIVVALLTPAYVAGSIAEEKDRRTLEFLLATDLRNREIVLSKLGSRLGNMTLLLLTGLPILSFLQFLGGVDPNLVFMGFAATGLTMLGLGCISILHSVMLKKPRDAIALTYLFIIAYFALASVLYGFKAAGFWVMNIALWYGPAAPTVGSVVEVLNWGNPLVLIIRIGQSGGAGTLAATLPTMLTEYAHFYVCLSALSLTWAVLRLRAIALKETYGKTIKLKAHQRYRPAVGELPMVWKELVIEGNLRLNWLAWGVVVVLLLLTLGTGGWIVLYHAWDWMTGPMNNPWRSLADEMNVWIRIAGTGVACLTLLWVAVRASTSVGIERDKQTFDALITSPLSADEILSAKLLGSIVSCRLGMIWFGAMLSLALLAGGIHVLAVPIVLGAWLIYACCFAMMGLWFSMVCKTALRATVFTVLTTVGVSVGHWLIWMCCGPLFMVLSLNGGRDSIPEYMAKFQAGQTPPFVLGVLMYSYEDLTRNFSRNEFGEMVAFSLISVFLWGAAAVACWFGLLSPHFRKLTRRDEGVYP